jgi:hypothetical protein
VYVEPTVPEPPPTYMEKGKAVIGRDVPAVAEPTQIPPTKREPPICHHCGLNGHIRPKCRLQKLKVKKEPPRKATSVTRPLKEHLAPQHQWQQQQFVPAIQNGKTQEEQIKALQEEAAEARKRPIL